jgi:hypothetical protein
MKHKKQTGDKSDYRRLSKTKFTRGDRERTKNYCRSGKNDDKKWKPLVLVLYEAP